MAIKLYSLGAVEEVTGSKHVLAVAGKKYMVDCGAFQGKRHIADEKNRQLQVPPSLEAVVLTHGHYDHTGLLPLLCKRGFTGNIYATPATRDISNIIMMDSARIQARDAQYLAKQAAKKGEKFTWKPLFEEEDCIKAAEQIVCLSYKRKMHISPEVTLQFFDAGHILGSALALLTVYDEGREVRILYSGDLGRSGKPIIRDPEINIPAFDYLYLESTYGDRLHAPVKSALVSLEKVVNEAIARGGKIIIPSFAVERAQELIYYLNLLTMKKLIPPLPIYVDSPMATNVTSVFRVHPECYDESVREEFLSDHKNPFGFGNLRFTSSVEESKRLNEIDKPCIIISADGMCEAGRILYHLANNIENEKNTILIVGYMAENTLGRKILDGQKEVAILGEKYSVKAKVESIDSFSAHADYEEMCEWLKKTDTSRLKHIFIVHGEKKAQSFFQKHLAKNGFTNSTIVKYKDVFTV